MSSAHWLLAGWLAVLGGSNTREPAECSVPTSATDRAAADTAPEGSTAAASATARGRGCTGSVPSAGSISLRAAGSSAAHVHCEGCEHIDGSAGVLHGGAVPRAAAAAPPQCAPATALLPGLPHERGAHAPAPQAATCSPSSQCAATPRPPPASAHPGSAARAPGSGLRAEQPPPPPLPAQGGNGKQAVEGSKSTAAGRESPTLAAGHARLPTGQSAGMGSSGGGAGAGGSSWQGSGNRRSPTHELGAVFQAGPGIAALCSAPPRAEAAPGRSAPAPCSGTTTSGGSSRCGDLSGHYTFSSSSSAPSSVFSPFRGASRAMSLERTSSPHAATLAAPYGQRASPALPTARTTRTALGGTNGHAPALDSPCTAYGQPASALQHDAPLGPARTAPGQPCCGHRAARVHLAARLALLQLEWQRAAGEPPPQPPRQHRYSCYGWLEFPRPGLATVAAGTGGKAAAPLSRRRAPRCAARRCLAPWLEAAESPGRHRGERGSLAGGVAGWQCGFEGDVVLLG